MADLRRTFDSLVLVAGSRFAPPISRRIDALRALGVHIRTVDGRDDVDAVTARDLVLDGDSEQVCRVLDEQLRRRSRGRVPDIDADPAWTLQETGGDPLRHRVIESLFTVGAGGFATRGAVEEPRPDSVPMVLAAGVYTGRGPDEHLMAGPVWTALDVDPAPVADEHVLDLRTGTLLRQETTGQIPFRSLRFASAARPGVVALRAEGAVGRVRAGKALRLPDGGHATTGVRDGHRWARVVDSSEMTSVAWQRQRRDGDVRTVERLAVLAAGRCAAPPHTALADQLEAARQLGFDSLLAEHRAVWAARWDAVDVEVPDAPEIELAIRFALFQLWCNVGSHDEAAVGARGLSGRGYSGHVFWDADVFVLPAIATMDPRLAVAMVDYRFHRMSAARVAARAAGRAGARFPWESASCGLDVTPTSGYLGGIPVPIRTGALEEHVTADVAWAAWHCAQWTGAHGFLRTRRPLLEETARYWASRCRVDDEGRTHIDDVIGPDEYHEAVSDNAFTNVMARWNLRAAAGTTASPEARAWRQLADSLVDGHQPETGLYEQFAGYFDLEPLVVTDVARAPVAADVLLGRERLAATQIIKQPDVLMLHHLVPDEVAPGSLVPNLDFYGPRTAHGSSLSPAISAALLARAGRPDEALSLLRIALRIDLDDLTGTTAAGLHLAAMGGAWQAVLFGFAGVRVRDGVLCVDPVLPSTWRGLGVRFRCLGRHVRLRIAADDVRIEVDAPLRVNVCGGGEVVVTGSARIERRSNG